MEDTKENTVKPVKKKGARKRSETDRVNKVEKTDTSSVSLYNNMRCAFNIPHTLLYDGFKASLDTPLGTGASYSDKNILAPGQSANISRKLFDAYQKKSKAFQAMLSSRNLIVKDNGLTIDNRDFADLQTAQAPRELDGFGSKKLQSIVKEPAKIEIQATRTYTPEI